MGNLVNELRAGFERELTAVLEPGVPVALVDFPHHSNVGDSAIYAGEIAALHRLGHEVRCAFDVGNFNVGQARRMTTGCVVLLHGGGNLGDLWPDHHALREAAVTGLTHSQIVQLPQTIHFRSAAALEQTRRVFDAHPDLTVLCRDAESLELARRSFNVDARKVCDAAFALGPIKRPVAPEVDVLWLTRTDAEASSPVPVPVGACHRDWISPAEVARQSRRYRLISELASQRRVGVRSLNRKDAAARLRPRAYEALAREELARGLRMLASAEVVVTDRLHAHILCVLMDIPHVLIDSGYGKLTRFHEAWTRAATSVSLVDSPAEISVRLAEIKDRMSRTGQRPV